MSRRLLTAGAIGILAAVLAFSLQDVIQRVLIFPFLYAWWVISLYYHSIPEVFLWALATALILIMVVDGLLPNDRLPVHRPIPLRSIKGPIQSLAEWMAKAPNGIYYKWLIANRLGRLARETLALRQAVLASHKSFLLQGWDRSASPEIQSYFDAGLSGSFADYPRRRWPWQPQPKSPLDLDPWEVIAYLESRAGEEL